VVPRAQDGARRLTVFGFLLSQRDVVHKFGIEVFRPGKFKKYQVSLTRISELTGVEFHKRLHDADVMAGEGQHVPIADGHEIRGIRGARTGASSPPASEAPSDEAQPPDVRRRKPQ